MTTNGNIRAVRGAVPEPKLRALVRRSPEWKQAMDAIAKGKGIIAIRLPEDFCDGKVKKPAEAFLAALRRLNKKGEPAWLEVYQREGVIYVVRKSEGE